VRHTLIVVRAAGTPTGGTNFSPDGRVDPAPRCHHRKLVPWLQSRPWPVPSPRATRFPLS